ncbi:MAG: ribosome silencing factor [Pseudomonadota bacterium]
MSNSVTPDSILESFLIPAFERKALSVTAIDVKKLTSYTDTIIIIEAGSHRQVSAIAEHMAKSLKAAKIKALGKEGIKEGEWALLDYGHVIIHIFESKAKAFFNLEGLWDDAPRFDLSKFKNQPNTGESDDGETEDDFES